MSSKSSKTIQLLKGFKDILPEHQKHWEFFMSQAKKILEQYGFQKIDVPILEEANLYVKGTGKYTDIVAKELYEFEDKNGEKIALRPEFTPGICRSYIEHGMLNRPQPLKFYTFGPVFRHDNPQAGRFRQFHQLDLEAIGSDSPVLDAQLIIIAYRLLESLGLSPIVHLNSIGCNDCRTEYVRAFKQYLMSAGRKKSLCDNCKVRYTKNPLRILDCKEDPCQPVLADAPQIIDSLCEDCKQRFMAVLEQLDGMEISYILDVKLVRGLDYYTRTTFEIYLKDQHEDDNRSQSALIGGGRYDGLIELLGGRPTPAVGFAVGVERIISRMRDLNLTIPDIAAPDVFVAQLGMEARKECFKLYEKLIAENINVAESFSQDGLKKQLERADSLQVKFTLILGQRELIDKTVILRDMNSGIQEIINYDNIIKEIKKRVDSSSTVVKSYILEQDGSSSKKDKDTVKEEGRAKESASASQPRYKINHDDEEDNEKIINKL
ncbi:MAG: histidine--tRNA ligase [Candidatus Kuenenbacteria bacterium]